MCSNPPEFGLSKNHRLYSYRQLTNRIRNYSRRVLKNKETIYLTGGEPTTHPDFLKLIRWIRKNFPDNEIACLSNARMFCYEEFAKEVLKTEGLKLEIAFHGHTSALYAKITGVPNGFEQTVQGIKNVLRYRRADHCLELRIVLLRQNYEKIDALLNFAHANFKGLDSIILIFPEFEGQARDNFKRVSLTYSEIKRDIEKNIRKWSKKIDDLRLYHFPLCALDPEFWPSTWRTLPERELAFPSSCENCLYKRFCMGVHKDYLKIVGEKEFHPLTEKISLRTSRAGDFPYHPIISVSE